MAIPNLQVNGLYPKDELALYLTHNNLKPAAIVVLTAEYVREKEGVLRDDYNGDLKIIGDSDLTLNYEEIQQFRKDLVLQDLVFRMVAPWKEKAINVEGQKISIEQEVYCVASNNENLKRLLVARNSKDDVEIGKALGYPELASKYYKKQYGGNFIDGDYKISAIREALLAEKKIPSWMGYIWHVPVMLDIVNDIYSFESEQQGKKYEMFTKSNNFDLSLKIDAKLNKEIAAEKKQV